MPERGLRCSLLGLGFVMTDSCLSWIQFECECECECEYEYIYLGT